MTTVGQLLADAAPLTADNARTRIVGILDNVADFRRPCKACGRALWFVRTRAAKLMPYTDDGAPHWADCPGADELRRGKPRQAALAFTSPNKDR